MTNKVRIKTKVISLKWTQLLINTLRIARVGIIWMQQPLTFTINEYRIFCMLWKMSQHYFCMFAHCWLMVIWCMLKTRDLQKVDILQSFHSCTSGKLFVHALTEKTTIRFGSNT